MNQITPSACRYHRRALGLTQTGLAKAAGSSTSYVKMFESERIKPSQDFIDKLSSHFTAQGIPPEKLTIEYAVSPEKAAPAAIDGRLEGMATLPQVNVGGQVEERQCFFIARGLPQTLVEDYITRIEENEDRLADLFTKPTEKAGLFFDDGFSEDTEEVIREVFGRLAESFVLFRLLTGWPLLDGEAHKADTVGAVIASHYEDVLQAKQQAKEASTSPEIEEVAE